MRRFTMLASLLMVLCLQMAAQTWEDVKVGTSTRKTLTYVPKNVEKSPALVISLHGMNQDPGFQQNQTQWNALADTEGFIVTYPLGNNRMWDTSGMGDVKFVEAVMKDMELKYHVDKNRIYLSGFSMGSWLGYHCLETLGDKIAAFGPVSGVDIGKQPRANRMVPIMHIHGTADDVFKYTGDPHHMAGGYPSIEEYVKKWAAYEGCDTSNPQVIRPYPAGRNTANDTRTIYNNVNDDVEVTLISIDGKGHWHSNDPYGVNSTQELWNFFKRHQLNQHPVPVENRNYFIRYESTVGENLWDRQAVYTLPKALEKDAKYTLTMKVRTSADCAELAFWPIWNASDHKNQWGGSDDVQYLEAYSVEAGDWKTLTWNFTTNFTLDTFQFVFGKYGGTLDIDDMVLVKEGTSENLIANADFSARNIQGWSTNWKGPSYSLASEAYASTGIEKPAVAIMMKSADKAYYTLQGVKVIRPTKGIYIHGGKKIVIK
ncbi:alpha/beta hydrolase family esterase [Segatella copri]|jgi:poly(3-hydroxybutyrate) depolymerase|uniref:alpha/beta hydrolase family esterase n=1 Tax=Segatella copri TaxID=165179 RepID=UPI002FF397B4